MCRLVGMAVTALVATFAAVMVIGPWGWSSGIDVTTGPPVTGPEPVPSVEPGVLYESPDGSLRIPDPSIAGYDITLISVELPITAVTADGTVPANSSAPNAKIGARASTLRQIVTVRPSPNDPQTYGDYVQVDRVGNPLTVEALIPLPMKDYWNRSEPKNDAQFSSFIGDPFFASGILNGVFGLKVPPAPRTDLLGVFVPDIERIDLTIPPTPLAQQNRLGPLGGDMAGWPFGGRRPNDDVVDIGFRALAGVLVPGFTDAPPLGDGVNQNDVPTLDHFPFHAPPHAGYLHSQEEGTNGNGIPTTN